MVPDDLEDELVGGQREDHHHQAGGARRAHEAVVGWRDVARSGRGRARSCRACCSRGRCRARRSACAAGSTRRKPITSRGLVDVDVEVPAGEAEDDAGLVLGGSTASTSIPSRSLTSASTSGSAGLARGGRAPRDRPPCCGRRPAAARRGRRSPRRRSLGEALLEALGGQRGVAVEVAERGLEAGVLEHPPDHAGVHPADGVDAGARHLPALEGDGELAGGVVEGGIDAVAREDLAGEGVEVGLGDLEVVAAEDLAGCRPPSSPPRSRGRRGGRRAVRAGSRWSRRGSATAARASPPCRAGSPPSRAPRTAAAPAR